MRVIEEGYTYNLVTAISPNIEYSRKNAQNNKKEKKKFAEILEEKSQPNNEPAGGSHIDITY